MPSAPKIPKDTILETAFNILVRDGYGEVNIKKVANELNCSTQPISWQFGGMDNFRKALLEYCISYVNKRFNLGEGDIESVILGIADTYVSIAYDMPNLYKYLYMTNQQICRLATVVKELKNGNSKIILDLLVNRYNISVEAAKRYLLNMEFYVHGIASYVAVGYIDISKQGILEEIYSASKAFIKNEQGS